MLNVDFDDKAIEKLASVICGDDYYENFCEEMTRIFMMRLNFYLM